MDKDDLDERKYIREEIRLAIKLAILGGDVPTMALVHSFFNGSIVGECFADIQGEWVHACLPRLENIPCDYHEDDISDRIDELDSMSAHIARLQAHLVIVMREIERDKDMLKKRVSQ